ncbi:MAG: bifunctional oligoribonuclease/PAP phosphatase NrnA [Elusimicrobiota bacterium]
MNGKKTNILNHILGVLKSNKSFFIAGHLRPDGDCIGSQLALASLLRRLGKKVEIYSHDQLPLYAGFLPGIKKIRIARKIKKKYDVAIILECSDPLRMGNIIDLEKQVKTVINIDHHAYHTYFGDLNFIDAQASSVAEQIYKLFLRSDLPLNTDEATWLYLGIVTDTGRFQHLNTKAQSLRTAAQLLEAGANPTKINRWVYGTKSYSSLLLLSKVLATLKLAAKGEIAYVVLSKEMYRRIGNNIHDTEEMIDFPTMVPGVKISLFFKETEESENIKISFRSVEGVDVNKLAVQLGGGGHKNAAGVSLPGSLNSVCKKVLRLAEQALKT